MIIPIISIATEKETNVFLKIKDTKQTKGLYLVKVPEDIQNFRTIETYPVSFMISGEMSFSAEALDFLDIEYLARNMNKGSEVTINVLCAAYINSSGVLTIGNIANLPKGIELVDRFILIDYDNHAKYSELTNSRISSLFEYASSVIKGKLSYEINEVKSRVGF